MESGGKFSEKVLYIYRKQLQEADLIVINKAELLDAANEQRLRNALLKEFPGKELLLVSARTGAGVANWFERVTTASQPAGEAMIVDYEVYAEGEALLGWLNATVQLASPASFDANALLNELATHMQARLNRDEVEIAHLKMTLSPDEGLGDIAAINLVRNDFVPELSLTLADQPASGQLIINLRAEGAPEQLKAAVEDALTETARSHSDLTLRLEHLEHFRPGKPQPTHRDASFVDAFVEPA